MDDHVFVSNVVLKKAHDGSWFVAKLLTSAGNFDLGQETSKDLDKSKLDAAIDDIRIKIVPQIQKFIQDEVRAEEQSKTAKENK